MVSLDKYIASRLHGYPDQWSRDQWARSQDAWEWFDRGLKENPFPMWMDGMGLRRDGDTPAPSLFTCQDTTDWFSLSDRHREIHLEVDFKPAPSLGIIHDAYEAARGEAELLVVGFPGIRPGFFDISVEGLYLPKGHAYQKRVELAFGREPNFEYGTEIGWEWFGGVW